MPERRCTECGCTVMRGEGGIRVRGLLFCSEECADAHEDDERAMSDAVYEERKRKALNCLRHAIEQAEKDQWFNALYTIGTAVEHGTMALQAIINREGRSTDA